MSACLNVHICAYMCMYIYIYVYIHAYKEYVDLTTSVCVYMYIYTCDTHTHIHTCINVYIYIYTAVSYRTQEQQHSLGRSGSERILLEADSRSILQSGA